MTELCKMFCPEDLKAADVNDDSLEEEEEPEEPEEPEDE